jgi:hypothetical protein
MNGRVVVENGYLTIDQQSFAGVSFAEYKEKDWVISESRFEGCSFENLRISSISFGAGKITSEYVDCSFDGSWIKALMPGRARFVRCSFRNVRMKKWICYDFEFIDCVFTGEITAVNFNADHSPTTPRERSVNRYYGNDFSGAKLKNVAFMGGVDLVRQKLPTGEGYIFLEDAEPVVTVALSRVYSWPESAEKKHARVQLEIALEDYIRGGQRQLLFSPHDMTSRDGSAERAFARLSEIFRSLGEISDAELAAAADEAGRRSVRGYPCTYFRASSSDEALRVVEPESGMPFDSVEATGIEPFRGLGRLVALIENAPWSFDTVPFVLLWPRKGEATVSLIAEGLLDDSSLMSSSVGLQELGLPVRDALAGVEDSRLPELAARWARGEELARYTDSTPESILDLLVQLVGLARRARDDGDWLYCRTGSD